MKKQVIVASSITLLLAITLSMYLLNGCQKNVQPIDVRQFLYDSEKPKITSFMDYALTYPVIEYFNSDNIFDIKKVKNSFLSFVEFSECQININDSIINYWENAPNIDIFKNLNVFNMENITSFKYIIDNFSEKNLCKETLKNLSNSYLSCSTIFHNIGYHSLTDSLLRCANVFSQLSEIKQSSNETEIQDTLIYYFNELNYSLHNLILL